MKKRMLSIVSLTIAFIMTFQNPITVFAETVVSGNGVEEQSSAISKTEIDNGTEATYEMTVSLNDIKFIKDNLKEITEKKPVLALLYSTKNVELKECATKDSKTLVNLAVGTQIQILDVEVATETAYLQVETMVNGRTYLGYVTTDVVVTNDIDYNAWRDNVLANVLGENLSIEGSTAAEISALFPSGYHGPLNALLQNHPNWVFVPFNTGFDFNTVVSCEREGVRSLVYKNVDDSWKSKDPGDYDPATGTYVPKSGSNWFRASEVAVAYCLNPINYMDEKHIFAFEQLAYNGEYQNVGGVKAIISGTWMNNRTLEDGSSGYYHDVFMGVGQATGVSPYHLASRVRQEQGLMGQAKLISGIDGYYNYFNIGASGGTEAAIYSTGIRRARDEGWDTRYKSILGGAQFLGKNYITRGQDSLYLEKFDVDNSDGSLFSHQYMQNIQAPTTESVSVYSAYSAASAINNCFVFKIPVYNNLPNGGTAPSYPVSEEFITRLYKVILGRKPDEEGLEHWKQQMKNGQTAADLVFFFFNSLEMINRNLNNSQYLDYAYRAILGREADAGGKKYWLAEMADGCTRNCILNGFINSEEFGNICKSFGVIRGNANAKLAPADKSAGQTKFVVRLYRNIFNREADEPGLNDWTGRLQNKKVTACTLVAGFVYSQEFIDRDFSDEEYVEIMYKTMLGRASDSAGKKDWVNRLKTGKTRDDVLRGFLYSPEFGNLCKEYGITIGSL